MTPRISVLATLLVGITFACVPVVAAGPATQPATQPAADQTQSVTVSGLVNHAGAYPIPVGGMKVSDALRAAEPKSPTSDLIVAIVPSNLPPSAIKRFPLADLGPSNDIQLKSGDRVFVGKDAFLTNPHAVRSPTVMVGGLVKRGGAYTVSANGISLIDALRAAEINSDSPDLTVTIIHHIDPSHLTIRHIALNDLGDDNDPQLRPDDWVMVQNPKPAATQPAANAPLHYSVISDVAKPTTYPLPPEKFTLTQALAAASVNVSNSQNLIISLSREIKENTVEETYEDLYAIRSGTAPDPPLQPNDTIYVGTKHNSSTATTKPG